MSRKNQFEPRIFAAYWINHVSRGIQKRFDQAIRPLGFGLAYVGVANLLDKSGPLLQRDLAIQYGIEQPTMAALLTRMERDGLVSRKPHPDDKRASLIALTAKARTKLPQVRKRLVDEARNVTIGLSDQETDLLVSLLKRVAGNFEGQKTRTHRNTSEGRKPKK